MQVTKQLGKGLIGLDICAINMVEIRQMIDIKERIAHVLNTHRNDKLKNEYLSDNELEMIHAILHVFTKDVELESKSAFINALNELKNSKPVEQSIVPGVGTAVGID